MPANRENPPQGALRQPDGGVIWRVWAPSSSVVSLVTLSAADRRETAMTAEKRGYFVHRQDQADEGLRYALKLADGHEYPDPASRWQPDGVHRPSALFFPEAYDWSDQGWRGVAREDLVIYELHVGTFTPEGTFEAIIPRLPQLLALGVTAIELMPVVQFPGERDWGYDAVYPYAVQNSYGGPRALQHFVNAAHQSGMAVILDVVYNHLGPEGNYAGNFGPYSTDCYRTPWGDAINFDGPHSDPVRQFAIDNARMWVRDFHVDGLRLDAVQTIYDFGPRHILADIQAGVEREAVRAQRLVHVTVETNQNDVRLVRRRKQGGYGLDGVWSDDFHHSIHALLTGHRDGYYKDFGRPEHVAKVYNDVFVYDGCYSEFHRRRRGSRVGAIDRTQFVVCVQNHDQVANCAQGDRLGAIVAPAAQRLACGLLLLSPCVPLLFMGEEYGETSRFPFFCSFDDPTIIDAVRRGRREECAALRFEWGTEILDPQAPETFAAAKLSWTWPEGSAHAQLRQLYQDLLAARRQWPALRDRRQTAARLVSGDSGGACDVGAAEGGCASRPAILLLQRGGDEGLLAVANLTAQAARVPPALPVPRPKRPKALAEPVAPAALQVGGGKLLLSTEDVRYGGARRDDHSHAEILPYELLVFASGGQP